NSRRINFTHNRLVVIGKKAAEHGIGPLLDLMMRDAEPRPTQHIMVTPGEAVDILKVKPLLEKVTALEIEKYLFNYGASSKVYPVILQDVIETLLSKTTAVTVPIIRVDKSQKPETLVLGGQAVFDDDQWMGDLNPKEVRGFLWIINKVRSGVILLSTLDGGKVSMEIVRTSGKMEPEITAKGLKMKVKVTMDLNLGSLMTEEKSLVSLAGLDKLAKQAEGYVKNEIKLAVKRAQQLKKDIFGFGGAVHRKYPREWREMEPVWNEMFSDLDVEIKVKAKVRLIGKINKPI
ncbi:MAG TPA: Ger(x)C family spore germination protein, partial [Bacillota bacterium]|nr:Ger(x)C family spore germination protein [Bacillota bacterium]